MQETSAQLEGISGILPVATPFILHRVGLPQAVPPGQGDTGASPMVFQHITLPGYPQLPGVDAHPAGDEPVTPAFLKLGVVGILMQDAAVNGAVILRPLMLNVNQCPLPAAEGKMLDSR